MERINVLIVDDHKLFREGLKLLLGNMKEIDQVWEASDGETFLGMIGNLAPELVLMDIEMPGMSGVEATRKALDQCPEMKVIALSMYSDDEYIHRMIEAGARGFLLKSSDFSEVRRAIVNVSEGRNYFPEDIFYRLIKNLNARTPQTENPVVLSDREKEVLSLICKGLSNLDIADRLFISKRTVDHHRASLLTKTGTNNTASLVIFAVKNKLVDI